MDTMPRVSIIILNWNGWKDTIECLESIYQITYPNYDVIVVDNGSENDSIEKIKEYAEGKLEITSKFFDYSRVNKPLCYIEYSLEEAEGGGGREVEIANLPPWKKIILLKNGKNFGFAEGNNIAIRYTLKVQQPEYILLLNNDTVVDRDFLKELVLYSESDPMVGFSGPKSYYYDYGGRADIINFAGGHINLWKGQSSRIGEKEKDLGQYDDITNVDYVEGSCLLARRKVVEIIGALDPTYFLYWEEVDWCMRLSKEGYQLKYIPSAKIWHKVAASNKGASNMYYFTRNQFLFMKKYATSIHYLSFLIYFFCLKFWFRSGSLILYHRDIKRWKSFIRGILDGIKIECKQ